MAILEHYVDLATAAYNTPPGSGGRIPHEFRAAATESATWYGNGFQGVVFTSASETIVAFSGTAGVFAPSSQHTANMRIFAKIIPNMAGSAYKLAKGIGTRRNVTLVGHSLGGALAQVVGAWLGVPFISFNGPGMATALRFSRRNITHPQQMLRSRRYLGNEPVGICFVVEGDPIARYGTHVGTVSNLPRPASGQSHNISAVKDALRSAGLARSEPIAVEPAFRRPTALVPQTAPVLAPLDLGPDFSVF